MIQTDKEPSSTDYRERRFYARGVYLAQNTSRMETARGRSRHKNNSKGIVCNIEGGTLLK